MRPTLLALAALSTALTATPVQAEVVEIAPSSPWNVNYADEKCRLQRLFEHEGKPYALVIEQNAPQPGFGLIIAGPELGRFRKAKALDLTLRSDLPPASRDRFQVGTLGDYGPAVIMASVSIADPQADRPAQRPLRSAGVNLDAAEKIERIMLGSGKHSVSLETGNMKAVFEALNACTTSLLVEWGLDVEQHKAYLPARFLNELQIAKRLQQAYPAGALAQGGEAIFRLRAIVEPDGQMSDCALLLAASAGTFNSTACRIMKDAQFEPARDAQGQPFRSYYTTNITYRIN